MKKITMEELKVILEKHKKWLDAEPDGERADLSNTDLSGRYLGGVNLYEANLTEADLTRASLYKADLYRADLTGARLIGANLYGADLRYANLTRVNLREAYLTGADLTEANLYRADLTEANLTEANLTGAFLYKADLTKANLTKANLTEANLRRADLTEANLEEADLTEANLVNTTEDNMNTTNKGVSNMNITISNTIISRMLNGVKDIIMSLKEAVPTTKVNLDEIGTNKKNIKRKWGTITFEKDDVCIIINDDFIGDLITYMCDNIKKFMPIIGVISSIIPLIRNYESELKKSMEEFTTKYTDDREYVIHSIKCPGFDAYGLLYRVVGDNECGWNIHALYTNGTIFKDSNTKDTKIMNRHIGNMVIADFENSNGAYPVFTSIDDAEKAFEAAAKTK